MKKITLFLALMMASMLVFPQQDVADIWVEGDENIVTPSARQVGTRLPVVIPTNTVLYDNGPLVTHPGGGFGGADASVLQTNIGLAAYGFGNPISSNYWVADDFTVPAGGWDIKGFGFFGYQSLSTTASTMTTVHIMIYDGPPDDINSTLIFGGDNFLTSSNFTNIYRVTDYLMSNTFRPIMLNACMFDLHLDAGSYWVCWQTGGTLSNGPYVPPVTYLGQTTTGNAMQFTSSWEDILDLGTFTPQGLPFLIYGPAPAVPVSEWALMLGGILIALAVFFRYKRS